MMMMGRCLLVAVASVAMIGAASAHAHLVSADPAAGGVIHAGPTQLKLIFSEDLEAGLSGVTVTASGATEAAANPAVLARENGKTLIVSLPAPLAVGVYTVNWHALSKDGHATHDSYSFTVAP